MTPFGDSALRFEVSGDPRARRALSEALRAVPGVIDAVVAEELGCVVLEPGADRDAVARAVASVDVAAAREVRVAEHTVDVVYDGEDLAPVASATGLSTEEVARAHSAADYVVSMVGFMPGFAYLRGLDERLVLPRRERPRIRVPKGSVGIAAKYTGIYPLASPGGWHLLGRTTFEPLGVLALGDRVQFRVAPSLGRAVADETPAPPSALVDGDAAVASLNGLALVVGPPRHGRMHEGIPRRGPLDRRAFAAAGGRTALEVFGQLTLDTPEGRLTIASGRDRAAYLGLEGDAGIGSIARRGDRVRIAGRATSRAPDGDAPVSVLLGPDDVGEEAVSSLLGSTFRVGSASNRVGVRLEGPPVRAAARPDQPSSPMVEGAIELTPNGLVVLGPDHPTTGGYPVIAVVRERSMDDFFALPVGAAVRFVA